MASGFHLQQFKTVYDYYIANASITPQLAPMATSYTPNFGTHSYWSDISASLASGASLITLTNFSLTVDTVNARVEFGCDDISEASQTFSTDKFSVVLTNAGATSTWDVLCTIDFSNGTLNPVNGTFAVTIPADGFAALNDN